MESGQGRQEPRPEDTGTGTAQQRRFSASRLRPRVEISRTPPPRRVEPEQPELMPEQEALGGPSLSPFGTPREFAGGRVRVYGCSPGCLIASLLVSLFLTLILNALAGGF